MNILNLFKQPDDTEEENRRIKKNNKKLRNDKESLREENGVLNTKIIAALEDNIANKDKFIYYHDLYWEAHDTIKENKSEMADYRAEIKSLKNSFAEHCAKIKKYIPSLSKCEKKEQLFILLQTLIYAKEEIPLDKVIATCNKLKITKSTILEDYPLIYEDLNVVDWNIEE